MTRSLRRTNRIPFRFFFPAPGHYFLLVATRSLAGIFAVINKRVAHNINLSNAFMFASGALLAASLLHIIPESMEGLQTKYPSLHDLGLYAGLSILGGLFFGMIIHAVFESGHSHSGHNGGMDAAISGDGGSMAPVSGTQQKEAQYPTVTQPSSPQEMGYDNLQELIASREGRALTDLKGLQSVCWNVILGDFVSCFWIAGRARRGPVRSGRTGGGSLPGLAAARSFPLLRLLLTLPVIVLCWCCAFLVRCLSFSFLLALLFFVENV